MKKIYVTQPSLPNLNEYVGLLKSIWKNKWLTNVADFHKEFEKLLVEYMEAKQLSLFVNGTIALITGLQALKITGEVITTPYSFVATTHALHWNGIKPVFCDIDENSFNIDPEKIESLITPKTTAILPVHVYGNPCEIEEIQHIADTYGLKVIYDAAHAFGVKLNNENIGNNGDISILSFHSTKPFNTVEGGAIVTADLQLKKRIDYLKNFGFADEITVVAPGINGKMNELIAAFGILQLREIEGQIKKRKIIANRYKELLKEENGIKLFHFPDNVRPNFAYYPILVQENYFESRDELYNRLRKNGIYARRYFYPLISNFPMYRRMKSSAPNNLPVANRIADQILCLPIYSELNMEDVEFICELIHFGK